jgi:hypothetical protein
MEGVLIVFATLMTSLSLGTPNVTFAEATPAHALCTDAASHLSWVGKAALKPRPDFSEQPIEGCLGEPLLLDDMLGAER